MFLLYGCGILPLALALCDKYMMTPRHYYVLNQDPRTGEVFEFIQHHGLQVEVHLNRTRFWVPEGMVLTELLLRFSECVHHVDDSVDLATGWPTQSQ